MIYTIGHEVSYMETFVQEGSNIKVGREEAAAGKYLPRISIDYPGGIAFKILADAQYYIDNKNLKEAGYVVFGLDADWDRDTVPSDNGWWHALLHDSPIIILEE